MDERSGGCQNSFGWMEGFNEEVIGKTVRYLSGSKSLMQPGWQAGIT